MVLQILYVLALIAAPLVQANQGNIVLPEFEDVHSAQNPSEIGNSYGEDLGGQAGTSSNAIIPNRRPGLQGLLGIFSNVAEEFRRRNADRLNKGLNVILRARESILGTPNNVHDANTPFATLSGESR